MRKYYWVLCLLLIVAFVWPLSALAERVVVDNVPYIHQVKGMNEDDFNGHNACGPTSASMLVQFHNVQPIPTELYPVGHSREGELIDGWYVYNSYTGFSDKDGNSYDLHTAMDMDSGLNHLNSVYGAHGYIVDCFPDQDLGGGVLSNCSNATHDDDYWAADKGSLVSYLENHGLIVSAQIISDRYDYIKKNIDAGLPLIGHSYVAGNGHYLVIIGYDTGTDGNEQNVIVNDPYGDAHYNDWNGTEDGIGVTYPLDGNVTYPEDDGTTGTRSIKIDWIYTAHPVGVYFYFPGWRNEQTLSQPEEQITQLSQPFVDCYNKDRGGKSGKDIFGIPWDNGQGPWVHHWPEGSSSQDTVFLQDFIDWNNNGHWWQLVLNQKKNRVFSVHGNILTFWHDNYGYLNYGEPICSEYDAIDINSNQLKLQEFEKNGILRFIGYDTVLEIPREYSFSEIQSSRASISKGIQYLRNHQLSNGSWSNDPAVTSLAVLAMLNAGYDESDPVVAGGIQYIISRINTNPDGSVHSVSGRYTYYTSIAILPLVATHNPDYHDEIIRMRNWLIGSQWDEACFYGSVNESHWYYGGFGYGYSIRPDLSNTQWALMGLKAADKELNTVACDSYKKVLIFLERCRNSDGGSSYVPNHSYGSIHTMTAASVWSHSICNLSDKCPEVEQDKVTDGVDSGIQWLSDRYSVTNNDGWGARFEYYYAVTLAKALVMSHKTKLGTHDWFEDLAGHLIDKQNQTDGNWPYTGLGGLDAQGDKEMNTCWSILSLQTRTLPANVDVSMSMILESHADLHIYDPQGRHMGVNYQTMMIEENIPGATFQILDADGNEVPYDGSTPDEGLRQVVNLPSLVAGSYRIELIGTSDGPFHFTINGIQDGDIVNTQTYEGDVTEGERLATNVTVTSMEGALTLLYEPLSILPTMAVEPDEVELPGFPGSIAEFTFTVSEIGDQKTLHSVSSRCIDIVGPTDHISGSDVTFDVTGFDITPGGEQDVTAYIPVPVDFVGPASGSIIIESFDGGAKAIAVTLLGDVTGPEAEIVVPYIDEALQDGVTLTATAEDMSEVVSLTFTIREQDGADGTPVGFEYLSATYNDATGKWEYSIDSTQLPDGYYVIFASAVDEYGNEGLSEVVPFSIQNWAVVELLPNTANNKAGRTMPVKFALRIAADVDPAQPFVYNEELEIRIYDASSAPDTILLQTSLYGDTSKDYRIDTAGELYITNFKTSKTPAEYIVEIWRMSKDFKVGDFTFKTVK